MSASTVPVVSFESPAFIPASCRLSSLALLLLECDIPARDVRAYVEGGRYSVTPLSIESVRS